MDCYELEIFLKENYMNMKSHFCIIYYHHIELNTHICKPLYSGMLKGSPTQKANKRN